MDYVGRTLTQKDGANDNLTEENKNLKEEFKAYKTSLGLSFQQIND